MLTWFFFNTPVQGGCEAFTRQYGCCGGLVEDEERREHLEVACDLATHYLCHPCALCQEGRELRRRAPHPGFNNGRSVFVMMPPMEQTMGRGMWAIPASCPCPAALPCSSLVCATCDGSSAGVVPLPSSLFVRKYEFVICDHVVLRIDCCMDFDLPIVSPVFVVRGPPSTC
jgi:hypothetical protein